MTCTICKIEILALDRVEIVSINSRTATFVGCTTWVRYIVARFPRLFVVEGFTALAVGALCIVFAKTHRRVVYNVAIFRMQVTGAPENLLKQIDVLSVKAMFTKCNN